MVLCFVFLILSTAALLILSRLLESCLILINAFEKSRDIRVNSFVLTIFNWLNNFSASTLVNGNKIIGTVKQ